jgi:predicted ferric reductase
MRTRKHRTGFDWVAAAIAFGVSIPSGYLVMRLAMPVVHDRYFPWIVGRACGLAAYVSLVLLVMFGMWLRHPWRQRFMWPHAEGQFRLHAAMGAAVLALVGAHIVSLVLDKWAFLTWLSVVVPGKAGSLRANSMYHDAVSVGVFALYGLVAIWATARLGGRAIGRQWLTVHRLALPTLALVWFHGVFAGADTARLRLFYIGSGLLVLALAATRAFGRELQSRRPGMPPPPGAHRTAPLHQAVNSSALPPALPARPGLPALPAQPVRARLRRALR